VKYNELGIMYILHRGSYDFFKRLNPKTQIDNSTIDQLCKLIDNEIEPIIFDLLKWLQDYN